MRLCPGICHGSALPAAPRRASGGFEKNLYAAPAANVVFLVTVCACADVSCFAVDSEEGPLQVMGGAVFAFARRSFAATLAR